MKRTILILIAVMLSSAPLVAQQLPSLDEIELKIPAPNWNGKVLNGKSKDRFGFKLKETIRLSGIGEGEGSDECFKRNNLKREYTSCEKTFNGGFEGKLDNSVYIGVFPDTYKDGALKCYEFYDDWYAAYYSKQYWDYEYIMIVDKQKNQLYKLDFSAFSKAPYTKPGNEDFVTQGVRNVHLVGDTLYVQHGHNTYASSSGGKNAYISAIDLNENKILWTTQPLTCNSTFVIVGNTIVCGYGFTSEPRYVYLVDLQTGKRRQKVKVEEVPFYVLQEGNQIHVIGRYGADYVFDMGSLPAQKTADEEDSKRIKELDAKSNVALSDQSGCSPCFKVALAEGKRWFYAKQYTQAKACFNEAKQCPDSNKELANDWISECDRRNRN